MSRFWWPDIQPPPVSFPTRFSSCSSTPINCESCGENPALIEGAVEESLRYDAPFQRNRRIAKEDVTIDGKQIGKGQLVLAFLGAANRDPAYFLDPDSFDIERKPNRHISFGAGVHFCLGASLSRLEARIAINTILARMPDLRLGTENLEWENNLLRGLKALPLSF